MPESLDDAVLGSQEDEGEEQISFYEEIEEEDLRTVTATKKNPTLSNRISKNPGIAGFFTDRERRNFVTLLAGSITIWNKWFKR
jgi:hypothetical protein